MSDSIIGKVLVFDPQGRLKKPYKKFYQFNPETGKVEEVRKMPERKRLPNPFRKVE